MYTLTTNLFLLSELYFKQSLFISRLFSDGGNFCPEEIEEYRKRLEKMSNKIDSSEGFIMADLEGMESKRLEQASKISAEFEDRYRNYIFTSQCISLLNCDYICFTCTCNERVNVILFENFECQQVSFPHLRYTLYQTVPPLFSNIPLS